MVKTLCDPTVIRPLSDTGPYDRLSESNSNIT